MRQGKFKMTEMEVDGGGGGGKGGIGEGAVRGACY